MHMGDLGYGLTQNELAPFVDRCDVLLTLAGQTNTLPFADLDGLIDYLKPRWIVPMHYRLWWPTKMRPLDEFLAHRQQDQLFFARTSTVEFPLNVGSRDLHTIVVLEPSGQPAKPTRFLTPETAPVPDEFVAHEAEIASAAVVAFTEGPAYHADGSVYFSDIINNRIMKLSADGKLSVFRENSGRAKRKYVRSTGSVGYLRRC